MNGQNLLLDTKKPWNAEIACKGLEIRVVPF
jgi:hypothetical protein